MIFFSAKEFLYMIFDYKNGYKNKFNDNNEKSCTWSRNMVSCKKDFKVQWLRDSHVDSVGVKKLLSSDLLCSFLDVETTKR